MTGLKIITEAHCEFCGILQDNKGAIKLAQHPCGKSMCENCIQGCLTLIKIAVPEEK